MRSWNQTVSFSFFFFLLLNVIIGSMYRTCIHRLHVLFDLLTAVWVTLLILSVSDELQPAVQISSCLIIFWFVKMLKLQPLSFPLIIQEGSACVREYLSKSADPWVLSECLHTEWDWQKAMWQHLFLHLHLQDQGHDALFLQHREKPVQMCVWFIMQVCSFLSMHFLHGLCK